MKEHEDMREDRKRWYIVMKRPEEIKKYLFGKKTILNSEDFLKSYQIVAMKQKMSIFVKDVIEDLKVENIWSLLVERLASVMFRAYD